MMGRGVVPQGQPCAFCKKLVNELDATWYEGLPYHEAHFKLYLANELKLLDKKKELGTLTLAEAHRMADVKVMYDIERETVPSPQISKQMFPEIPIFKGHTQLHNYSVERIALGAGDQRKVPQIESKQVKQICGDNVCNKSENEPVFPVENKENLRPLQGLKNSLF